MTWRRWLEDRALRQMQGLAEHHQHPALAGPDRADQPVQHVALAVAAGQPRRTAWPLRCGVWVHLSIVAYW